jgi:hypothetical protein
MMAVTTEAETEVEEVPSKEESLNQSDSSEEKLMHKRPVAPTTVTPP